MLAVMKINGLWNTEIVNLQNLNLLETSRINGDHWADDSEMKP